jgi:predicted RNA-binding Zn-ribbon protein involved in translation (DUF1610 family)
MTREEFERKYKANHLITGYESDVKVHAPCPFCAAPEFLVWRVLECREVLAAGGVCPECGRGCKAIFRDTFGGGVEMEFVQTSGEPSPDYLPPIRRVDG